MKGVKIERALPGNLLDVYALFKDMAKEGQPSYPRPTEGQIKEYYWTLLNLLSDPSQIFLLARKGHAFYGFLHACVTTGPFGENRFMVVNHLFVVKNKRKLGIGRKLIEEILGFSLKVGVRTVNCMLEDSAMPYFVKKYGVQKRLNLVSLELK